MDCRDVANEDVAEAYVAGRLEQVQREAFEAHYFECPTCFERLEVCRALRQGLSEQKATRRRSARRERVWEWSGVLAAAAVLAVAVLWTRPGPPLPSVTPASPGKPPERTATLATLGRFDPPSYSPVTWRNASTMSRTWFDSGMARYAARDYKGAIADLERAASASSSAPQVHFFLGICRLLTGDVEAGIAGLERTVAQGDTPFLESARFYLARAALLKNDRRAAETYLGRVIALRGELALPAQQLLHAMADVPSEPEAQRSAAESRAR
jgi:tetratricopeptide (TPR) repeat protein